jgi:hypothetical protein
MRQVLADEKESSHGALRVTPITNKKKTAVHRNKGYEVHYEVLNRTQLYGKYFDPYLNDPQDLRYTFDRIHNAQIEFTVHTMDYAQRNSWGQKLKVVPECVSWSIRVSGLYIQIYCLHRSLD